MTQGRVFLMILAFFCNELKENQAQSTLIENLPDEILEEIFQHSSLGSIENFKYVCRRFYIFSYQYFGIDRKIIHLLSHQIFKHHSEVLAYHCFYNFYQLKKMFSIFLNSQNIDEQVKLVKIGKFQFKSNSIHFQFQQAMLAKNPDQKNALF